MRAIYVSSSANMKAMVGSIALHALAASWFLSQALPIEVMPQQIIEVTLVAPPSTEHDEQKSLPAKQPVRKPIVKTSQRPKPQVTRKVSAHAMHKAEAPPAPVPDEKQLSDLSPAAGQSSNATETAQLVMTKPLFDAAYLKNPAPEYPAHAKRRGMEGIVMLDVLVKHDGVPQAVIIAESSGFSLLDHSAKEAVSRWKFIPAKRGNETVEARVMVPIEFRLE